MKKTISFSTEVEVLTQSVTSCVVLKHLVIDTSKQFSYSCAAEYLRTLIKEAVKENDPKVSLPIVHPSRMETNCSNVADATSDCCEYIIDCKHFAYYVELTLSRIMYEYK